MIPAWIAKLPPRLGHPKRWPRPASQPLKGAYAKNTKLAALECFDEVAGTFGPESLAIGPDGLVYSGFDDGTIVRFSKEGKQRDVWCHTGGRPLGMRFHPDGSLIVCDTTLGLIRITENPDTHTKQVERLAHTAGGTDFGFADDLDITVDGRFVYFSDASSKWHYNEDHLDMIEHGGHGRLVRYDFETGQADVLMSGLHFANGVTLGPDEAYLLVAETGSYCVHKYWLKGDRAGSSEIFLDNLPGFPDNIRFNGKDRFWLAIPVPRNPIVDVLAPFPALRLIVMQYARWFPLPIKHAAIVLGFDLEGRLTHNLQNHGRKHYHFVTQVLEHEGYLYCSSLHDKILARYRLGDD